MRKSNEFYIGWKDKMSKSNSRFLKRILVPLFLLIPILSLLVVLLQKPFNKHKFFLGDITTVTGTYFESPVPMLIADEGELSDSISRDIILVGYGKFGAKSIIQNIETDNGSLNGKKVSLSGSLIYGDNKTVLELTAKENSLIKVLDNSIQDPPLRSAIKKVTITGEIIDPKCYFGVMKPGEGKIHKSCAIRCISGGIPPILKTKDENGESEYFILLGETGQAINEEVLHFVAEEVSITGLAHTYSNWEVLHAKTSDIKIQ